MYTTPKRFPPICRFYSQGICRAGQDCSFAHILPFSDKISDDVPEKDSQSIQKAIRELEIIQVEKKYQRNIKRTTNFQNHTLVELLMDLEKDQQIDVHVVIPRLYPDIHCTLQVQHTDLSSEKKSVIQAAFEDDKWHQMQHKTLVQQLDWLTTYFNKYSS